jgi:hypothetical protein
MKMHFCGSFAPITFIKEGIWPRSFEVALPVNPILTAWILKILNLDHIKSFAASLPSASQMQKRWYALPVVIIHDGGGAIFETILVITVVKIGATAVINVFNPVTGEEKDINIDENAINLNKK